MKFARLFELENGEQMLVTVDYNTEEECYSLTYRTDHDGISYRVAFGFDSDKEEYVRKKLDEVTMDDVVSVWKSLLWMLD